VKGIIEGVLSTLALVIFFAILPMVNMAEITACIECIYILINQSINFVHLQGVIIYLYTFLVARIHV
jgi:hypothetical protein